MVISFQNLLDERSLFNLLINIKLEILSLKNEHCTRVRSKTLIEAVVGAFKLRRIQTVTQWVREA